MGLKFKLFDDSGFEVYDGNVLSYSTTIDSMNITSIYISGEVFAKPAKKYILINIKDEECQCGAYKTSNTPKGAGHSSWCPWSKT